MALVSINEELFKNMLSHNPSLKCIKLENNVLTFENQKINLENFSFQEIYNDYSQLKADIDVIKPNDFFNIVKINVTLNDHNRMFDLPYQNLSIKNVRIITKKDDSGRNTQYVQIITDKDTELTLYDYQAKDVFDTLKNMSKNNNNDFVGIKVSDLTSKLKDEEVSVKKTPNQYNVPILININDIVDLINKEELSEYEQQELISFHQAIFELRTYRQYLNEFSLELLNKYEYYIQFLASREDLNEKEQEELNQYNEETDIVPKVELNNSKEKELLLKKENKIENQKRMAGYASSLLIVEVTCFVAIAIASLLFILVNK